MLKKLKQRKQEGFTIIEVLIVLAIAGLIMLVVFMAVPALQRNSRNTQRKNDVSTLLGAIQEYSNNNNGAMPTAATDFLPNAKRGFYSTDSNVRLSVNPGSAPSATVAAPGTAPADGTVTTDQVVVITGYKCGASATAAPTRDATRSIAIIYAVEAPTGNGTFQCQSL